MISSQGQFDSAIAKRDSSAIANNIERLVVGKYLTAFQRKSLQKSLQEDLSDKQWQRIAIMLLADAGKTQNQICQQLGCSQATARHWMMMVRTDRSHDWNSQHIGRPTTVNEQYLARLRELVLQSPQAVNVPNGEYKYSFKRWTAQKLCQHLHAELKIAITPQHLNRLLKQMGLSTRRRANSPSTSDRVVVSPT